MISIEVIRAGLLWFDLTGRIEKADVEAIITAIENERQTNDTLSLVVDMSGFAGMTPEALVADLRYSFSQLGDLSAYRRIAIITGHDWVEALVRLQDWVLPSMEMATFEPDERDKALEFAKGATKTSRRRKPGISAISTDRADAIAFRITDQISHDDARALFARLDDIYAHHDKVDLMVIIEDFEGFDPSLVFDRKAWSAKAAGVRHIRRYAIVGGPEWLRGSSSFFGSFLPMDIKTFARSEEDKAWAWINAGERDVAA